MALDKQRILGELGSVMKQLQSADCGCLGKLFGNPQQAASSMGGKPLPTCGGCRRACCYGHGCYQQNSQAPMNQPAQNMNCMSMDGISPSQPMSGNMHGFGPQIVNMMRGDHAKPQNFSGQGQGQGQMQGQLTGQMVIDAPQSPHGKIGLTPVLSPSMVQQQQHTPAYMNQGDVAGQMQNQFMGQPHNMTGNVSNINSWPQQSMVSNPGTQQMSSPQQPNITPWSQEYVTSNLAGHQMPTSQSHQHGQHSEGIAKFHTMFPGVKQGLGGDLGFDPMAIAIQMNPDNHLHSAMDTMHKIMNDNSKPNNPQGVVQSSTIANGQMQQNIVPGQFGQSNQFAYQQGTDQNTVNPTQMGDMQQNMNTYRQPIPQQNQQVYQGTVDSTTVNQQVLRQENTNRAQNLKMQQYGQQQIMDLNYAAPNLPTTYEETEEVSQSQVPLNSQNIYSNEPKTELLVKDPIFPVDTSQNQIYSQSPTRQQNNYVYNTLGQPVEMFPAKIFHPPEPTLPQTLSPQPIPEKPKYNALRAGNVKATVSKTSIMGNKPTGKSASRTQLQRIYNQYKGSQSFTQQNVRHPREGTRSDGRINVPQENTTRTPSTVPVERIGGDTVVNNPPSDQVRTAKIDHVMGQIGDVPTGKPTGDSPPEASVPIRKCRNGLQDVVFTSYPSSAAWTFHGDVRNRNSHSPAQRYRSPRY